MRPLVVRLVLLLVPRMTLLAAWGLTDWIGAFDAPATALLACAALPCTSLTWNGTFVLNEGRVEGIYAIFLVAAVLLDLAPLGGWGRAGGPEP